MDNVSDKRAWLITVDMGYGHQRPADGLKSLAFNNEIINANNYEGIPEKDRQFWNNSRSFYEKISAFTKTPFIGKLVFSVFDFFQRVESFYPKRKIPGSTFALRQIASAIKGGWGKDLIEKLKIRNKELEIGQCPPIVSTFFTPALMAEYFNYPGEIFCVICDTDISRTWAPLNPGQSRIKYFVPTPRAKERLESYVVRPENVFLTGFPLPQENIGSENMEILKEDLKNRLQRLDPNKKFIVKYQSLIKEQLGEFSKEINQETIT